MIDPMKLRSVKPASPSENTPENSHKPMNQAGSAGSSGSDNVTPMKPHGKSRRRDHGAKGFRQGSEGSKAGIGGEWVPAGFRRLPNGSIEHEEGADNWQWLCSNLEVAARTRTAEGEGHGRLLVIVDHDGVRHEWAMPASELSGSGEAYRARLLGLGLELAPGTTARNALHRLLTAAKPSANARCVTTLGWHGDAYLLPDGPIGETGGERLVLQTSGALQHNFNVAGTLDGWQRSIGRWAEGNSRLTFAVSMAFAGPLLRPLSMEGGGVHFRGGSSCGKTTSAEVAGSVCGGGRNGYKQSWRGTDNGTESTAAAHNDGLLILDEIGQVNADALGSLTYMLANGQAKRRMNKDTSARATAEWRLLFLSTGEIGLSDKIQEGRRGGRAMAGQQVRILDLPADAGGGLGIFETLHGHPTPADFADALKAAAASAYGHPLRAFLNRLIAEPAAAEKARSFIAGFVTKVIAPKADGQVIRAAQRFGLVAAAGELAQQWGVVPWAEGCAMTACARLFNDWVTARGGSEPAEITTGLAAVRHFVQAHKTSRFTPWESPSLVIHNCAGFWQSKDNTFYIYPEAWKADVLAGQDASLIAQEMVRRGFLKANTDGKPQTKQRLPDGSERRVYVVLPAIFKGEP